jgi:hypothetical protein
MEGAMQNAIVTDLLLCFTAEIPMQRNVMEDKPHVIFDGTHEAVCYMRRIVRSLIVWSER